MTKDEIAKLAREYAEDSVDKYLPDTPLVPNARIRFAEAVKTNTERLIRFLLRTHCIVSKEKVRNLHTALSIDKSMLRNWEEREIFDVRISMLNHLFGKDLFIDNDGRT